MHDHLFRCITLVFLRNINNYIYLYELCSLYMCSACLVSYMYIALVNMLLCLDLAAFYAKCKQIFSLLTDRGLSSNITNSIYSNSPVVKSLKMMFNAILCTQSISKLCLTVCPLCPAGTASFKNGPDLFQLHI